MTIIRGNHPRCEANLPQLRVLDYGFAPMRCSQWVGLRSFLDANGTTRYSCAAPGHHAQVVRRFGVTPYGDPITAAMTEAERREAWGR